MFHYVVSSAKKRMYAHTLLCLSVTAFPAECIKRMFCCRDEGWGCSSRSWKLSVKNNARLCQEFQLAQSMFIDQSLNLDQSRSAARRAGNNNHASEICMHRCLEFG